MGKKPGRRDVFRKIRLGAAALGLFASFVVPASLLQRALANDFGLREIGTMKTGVSADVTKLVVDPELNIGLTLGLDEKTSSTVLVMHDLESLRILEKLKEPSPGFFDGLNTDAAAVDHVTHKVYFPPGDRPVESAACPAGPSEALSVRVLHIPTRSWSTILTPCYQGSQFKIQGLFFYRPTNKLYVLGMVQGDRVRALAPVLQGQIAQTAILRQLDLARLSGGEPAVDWERDLRAFGCDRVINVTFEFGAFVARHGDNVFSYCYGPRDGVEGRQGFGLRIPLTNEQAIPLTDSRPSVRVTPTLPNELFPMFDADSGRMLLMTTGSANGFAVWVYDPANERFFGVIPSGVPGGDDPRATTYVGLNQFTGRTYFLTTIGILVADARHSPLPSGLNFPVLNTVRDQGSGPFISVAPKLRRLFVPVARRGFVVLEDRVPDPPPAPLLDPDRGTADVPEVPGKTGSVFSGAAAGFGSHLLVTGGIPKAANNQDPLCVTFVGNFVDVKDRAGRCLAEQVLTSGNREFFMSPTQVEIGSETGVTARASGGSFASNDTSTDADFKRLSTCEEDPIKERLESMPSAEYRQICAKTGLSVFSHGTRGADGKGFPIPASECEDFGEAKKEDRQRWSPSGLGGASGTSFVSCSGAGRMALAKAESAGLAYPNAADPLVAVQRTWSSTLTEMTSEGLKTTVTSAASGITLGNISIGEVKTQVTTRAHGRTGTTRAMFERTISRVSGPGFRCDVVDSSGDDGLCSYGAIVDAINQSLGQRIRITLPQERRIESPRGYQALVLKDTALRDSDRATNDDDSFAVSGMQIAFFNDGRQGRNRLVLQLAGVQAESRYGIFLLPEESGEPIGEDIFEDLDLEDVGDLDALGSGEDSLGERIKDAVGKVVAYPFHAVRDAYELIVHNPKEFGVLLALWSLLASPAYFVIRRWAGGQALAA